MPIVEGEGLDKYRAQGWSGLNNLFDDVEPADADSYPEFRLIHVFNDIAREEVRIWFTAEETVKAVPGTPVRVTIEEGVYSLEIGDNVRVIDPSNIVPYSDEEDL
jgi:hypothetical protein